RPPPAAMRARPAGAPVSGSGSPAARSRPVRLTRTRPPRWVSTLRGWSDREPRTRREPVRGDLRRRERRPGRADESRKARVRSLSGRRAGNGRHPRAGLPEPGILPRRGTVLRRTAPRPPDAIASPLTTVTQSLPKERTNHNYDQQL